MVTTPGSPRVGGAHYPPALNRTPKPRTAAEAQFLAIGDGAWLWLAEEAVAGVPWVRAKMAWAVPLAALRGLAATDQALGRPKRRRMTRNALFASPSQAADVLHGHSVNGADEWGTAEGASYNQVVKDEGCPGVPMPAACCLLPAAREESILPQRVATLVYPDLPRMDV